MTSRVMPDEQIRLVHTSGESEIDLIRRELRVLGPRAHGWACF
jgi:hypothetical protein